MHRRLLYIVSLLVSLLAAYCGLGLSYRGTLFPADNFYRFQGIHSDGWIQQNGKIVLPELEQTGNRLELNFGTADVDPNLKVPAKLEILLCGNRQVEPKPLSDFAQATLVLELSGSCQPQQVSFHFIASEGLASGKARLHLLRLNSARVTSSLGFPLIGVETVVIIFALVFVSTLLAARVFALWTTNYQLEKNKSSLLFLVPLFCLYLLSQSKALNLVPFYSLLIFFDLLCLGALVNLHFGAAENKSLSPEPNQISRLHWFLVFWLLLIGCGIRLYGLDFGLPANFHPDEARKVSVLVRLSNSPDWNPHYFLHPSLLLYSSYFVNKLVSLSGIGPDDARQSFVLAGRLVSALSGTLSIGLVFLLARLWFCSTTGLISAALVALCPLTVTCSRYMKEDALFLFFVLACLLSLSFGVKRKLPNFILLAGLLAGLATSSKYSGALSAGFILAAPWLSSGSFKPNPALIRPTLVALFFVPLGFVMATPYSLLDFEHFLAGLHSEQQHMLLGHLVPISPWSEFWMFHLRRSLMPGMSWLVSMISIVAIGYLARRGRTEDLFLVATILIFYLPAEWVRAKPAPQPERYVLPCVPFLAIAAAQLLVSVSNMFNQKRLVSLLLAVPVIFIPLFRSIALASELRPDTRELMTQWISNNISPQSRIALDCSAYNPPDLAGRYVLSLFSSDRVAEKGYESLKKQSEEYVLFSSLCYDRYFSMGEGSRRSRERLQRAFSDLKLIQRIQPRYGTYGFHNPSLELYQLSNENKKN